MNPQKWSLKFGDWVENNDPDYALATRPSDFMLGHLRAFGKASGNMDWTKVADNTYKIIQTISSKYSPVTGLLPDFVVFKNGSYAPSPPFLLETERDGSFSWNAARVPWRVPVDYLLAGDTRALNQTRLTNAWISKKTNNDPGKIVAGYKLNGNPLDDKDPAIAFSAPFAVSAMVDASNQAWLNALWNSLVSAPTASNAYYGNSIRLLCMITVSGNWWDPANAGN
ncbi:glycosyl hydrolase family 8 [Paenibacillus sonchi]|uniref:glycosyl hydrolase family 8 n=1 Tax=Paenibacillus sonchi TaxID=373687 RepID=UPI0002DB921A|nr:glycosyl hydrolase family 8 [Paenibacillus sonchi]